MKKILIFILLASLCSCTIDDRKANGSLNLSTASTISVCTTTPAPINQQPLNEQVSAFFSSPFDTQWWPARWQCGTWLPFHGWLYIGSDLTIALSYFLIPLILLYFIYKKKERSEFQIVLVLFVLFILACGLTHLMDAAMFWWPAYRLSALLRFATAIVSLGTVFMLIKVTPRFIEFRSPEDLEDIVKERTEELRKSTLLVAAYQRALEESCIVAITDQHGLIKHVNENFCNISKYSKEELIGKDHRIINSSYHDKEFIRDLWATITIGKSWRGQLKNKAKDGSIYWVDTTIVPFLDDKGKPYQYVAIRFDITESKKLEEQQAMFALIVNSSDDAIISENVEGIITSWNHGAEKQFGYSLNEITGKHISIIIPPHLQDEKNEIVEKFMSGNSVDQYETERIGKDGKIINVSLTISPIKDSFGNIIGASKISRNITERIKAEQELGWSELKFRRIFESKMVGIIFWDVNGEISDANERFLEMVGYTRLDLTEGKLKWNDMTPSEYVELDKQGVKQIELTGVCQPFEKEYFRKDGSRVPILIGAAMLDKDSSIKGVAYVTDITERKKAAQEKNSLQATLENSLNEIYIFDAQTLLFSYVNKGALLNLGYSQREIEALTPLDLKPDFTANSFKELVTPLVSNEKDKIIFFTNHQRKDGSHYPVEVHLQLVTEGNTKRFLAIILDITERKKAEEKLATSERIYKTIASSIPGLVILLMDSNYRYLLIEGDMLEKFGYSKERLLGNTAQEVLPPNRYQELLPNFQRVFGGEIFTTESNLKEFDINTRYVPLRDETSTVYAAMIVVIDVTELKKAEQQLAELNVGLEEKIRERTEQLTTVNKELEAFSYSVSHDLRAPLRSVSGYAKMLEEDYFAVFDDNGKRLLRTIQKNAATMGRLIDDLLAFSRLGRKEMQKSHVDMHTLAEEVIKEANFAGVDAEVKLHPLDAIWGDSTLLKQVLANYISNAIKYSSKSERPFIEIKSTLSGDNVIYSVSDNGSGFDMAYVDKLFRVFQRLHSNEEFEGTGVGLAIVDRIVKKHGGQVWAEGQIGKGATFYFSLPAELNVTKNIQTSNL